MSNPAFAAEYLADAAVPHSNTTGAAEALIAATHKTPVVQTAFISAPTGPLSFRTKAYHLLMEKSFLWGTSA
jgi:hypothetical protein